MKKLLSSRTWAVLRMGGMLLLVMVLALTTTAPGMASDNEIVIWYSYSFIHDGPLVTTVHPGETFTIHDEVGGCGPVHHDIAQVEVNSEGQIRVRNHDCLSGDGPGTFGAWVSDGCSSAKEFGFVVRACILDGAK